MLQRKSQPDCNKSKNQQALNADQKVIQQIKFKGNLKSAGNTKMFFIIEESVIDFSQVTVKVV